MNTLWEGLDRLLDDAEDVDSIDAVAHGVHLLAARRWRATGRPVPAAWVAGERSATVLALTFPVLLARIRAALDGPIVLLKGPEVAAHYPDHALRAYGDLDILVPDAAAAQRRLIAAGFVELIDYEIAHQQHPLMWRGMHLLIEVHNFPSWLRWMTPPSNQRLFEMATPSATGVCGIDTLPRAEHALLMAVHSWRHTPLRRLIDLVDVAVMADGIDRDGLSVLAAEWGLGPVWSTTVSTIDALFLDPSRRSAPLRTWARHLPAVRDRTVVEKHVTYWIGGFWAPTPAAKLKATVSLIGEDLSPLHGEPWRFKMTRMGRAARDAFERASPRSRDD